MNTDDTAQLQSLLLNPRESLDVELKQWLDPGTAEGTAKIAKACMALRNNNGGALVIGIQNDGTPDLPNRPAEFRMAFHQDAIQSIVGKYSSAQFEVTVQFIQREGQEYPVIRVPAGVTTPVACKADLKGANGEVLLKAGTVYVRTLNSNHAVSSAPAGWKDWDAVTKNCFDNREADIGAFLRRHLSGVDLVKLGDLIRGGQSSPPVASDPERQVPVLPPILEPCARTTSTATALERVNDWMSEGFMQFSAQCRQRQIQVPEKLGTLEGGFIIDGKIDPHKANQKFLNQLFPSMPHLSGWPFWLDSRFASFERDQPYVIEGGWEALLYEPKADMVGPHLDFWRIEPAGRFYHLRGLEDDMARARDSRGPEPFTVLDFLLATSRVTEMIAIGLSFTAALGADPQTTSLAYSFRWRNLAGRALTCWVDPTRFFRAAAVAHQNEIVTTATVPLETPRAAIAPLVFDVTEPLFALFGGMQFQKSVIEGIVQDVVQRRL